MNLNRKLKQFVLFLFTFSLTLYSQTIQYERNVDGTFKSLYIIQNNKQTNIVPERYSTGQFKGIYVNFIGDQILVDTILSISKNNKGKIRYDTQTEKWQFSNNGTTWYDLMTGYTETDPIFSSWDKSTGISISYTQVSDFNTGVNSNTTIIDLVSKKHDPATVNSPLNITGQNISLSYDTNTLSVENNNLKVKDYVFSSFGHTHYLDDLIDVDTTGLSDGKILKYSGSLSKWIPGEMVGGGDMYKSVYDTNDNTRVDTAETVSDGSNTSTALEIRQTIDVKHSHNNLSILNDIDTAFTSSLKSNYDTAYSHSQSSHPFGLVGTKEVDETDLGNGKVLKYDSAIGKWKPSEDLQGGGGGGTPQGSNKTIQYNNNGVFAGDDNLQWDSGLKKLSVSGDIEGEKVVVTNSVLSLPVLSSKPSAPPAGQIYVYYRNGAMYYQDSTGAETKMCETVIIQGGGTDVVLYETDIVFNFNGNNSQGYTSSNSNYGRVRKAEANLWGRCYLSTGNKKYGSASLYCSDSFYGSGFYVQNPSGFDLLDNEWTFEFWIYFSGEKAGPYIIFGSGIDGFSSNRDNYYFCYYHDEWMSDYRFVFEARKNGSIIASYSVTLSSGLLDSNWHHVAIERDKSNNPQFRLFLDGVEQTVTTTTAFSQTIETTGYFEIGGLGEPAAGHWGYIDDFRFRRQKVYTSNFTPPSEW